MGHCWNPVVQVETDKPMLPLGQSTCLTIIRSCESNIVEVVLDKGRLSIKDGDGGNPSVYWVDIQPAGWVIDLGVSEVRERGNLRNQYEVVFVSVQLNIS